MDLGVSRFPVTIAALQRRVSRKGDLVGYIQGRLPLAEADEWVWFW